MKRISVLFLLIATACSQKEIIQTSPLKGVWHVTEITYSQTSESYTDSLSSIFIFTDKHYSMTWVEGSPALRVFKQRWNPTDNEKIECYNSLVVNSGTYQLTDSLFTARPSVARVPDFIGGKLICSFKVSKDILILEFVDEYSFDGVQAPWVAAEKGLGIKLNRIE